MTVRTLAKENWQSYCDQISKSLVGKRTYIEVGGVTFGDQVAAKWLPLLGITYDSKDDLLEIAMEGIDHLIRRPTRISVDDGPDGLRSMEIVDSDRRQQIVKFAEPLLLSQSGLHTAQDERR
jgi:hypothetical protein